MYISDKPYKKNLLLVMALPIIIAVTVFPSFWFFIQKSKDNTLTSHSLLEKYAAAIVARCASASYHPVCYDDEIPRLLDKISMEDAFKVTEFIQEKDKNYFYCHVLGHNISGQETAKDPSKWKEVINRCPSGRCSNGCLHGAFQERFRAEALPDAPVDTLKKELLGVCKERPGWQPTGLERGTCYHALGHLAMYITAADIRKSTKLCDELILADAAEGYLQICYDGAFMQIFQPLEPEDFALVKGKQPSKKELHSFCWQFEGMQRGSCWSEGWPLFLQEIHSPDGLTQFCMTLDETSEQDRCFNALFFVLTAQFNLARERIQPFCSGLAQKRKEQCFANAAARLIETDARLIDQAAALCDAASGEDTKKACYKELIMYSTYNFHPGSEDFFRLCRSLPPPWNEQCIHQNR